MSNPAGLAAAVAIVICLQQPPENIWQSCNIPLAQDNNGTWLCGNISVWPPLCPSGCKTPLGSEK